MPTNNQYCYYQPLDRGLPRRRYYVSHGSPWFVYLHRASESTFSTRLLPGRRTNQVLWRITDPLPVVKQSRPTESDDEFCRRKDRFYEILSDDLAARQNERDGVKAAMVSQPVYTILTGRSHFRSSLKRVTDDV